MQISENNDCLPLLNIKNVEMYFTNANSSTHHVVAMGLTVTWRVSHFYEILKLFL